MKTNKKLSILIAVLSIGMTGWGQTGNPRHNTALDLEKEAIKQAIWKETDSYGKKDLKAWAECYVQDANTSASYALHSGERLVFRGFQSLYDTVGQWIANAAQDGSDYKAREQKNWDIQVSGDMAWAQFTEAYTDQGKDYEAFEVRILNKVNGQWKLVYLGFVQP